MIDRTFLFLELDDEVTTVISKVEQAKLPETVLVFPEKALIFHSAVNLKILFENLQSTGKTIRVMTDDQVGNKLLENTGFVWYEGDPRIPAGSSSGKESEPFVRIQKLKPDKAFFKPQKSANKKMSITELIAQEEKKRVSESKKGEVAKELHLKSLKFQQWSEKLLNITIKRRNFLLLLVLALALFLTITYIALPSATVAIRPASNILEKTVNVLLVDEEVRQAMRGPDRAHALVTVPIETVVEKELVLPATGTVFTGSHARGKIKIMNDRFKEWTLLAKTRFATKDGIIFRLQDKVDVPGATYASVRNEKGVLERVRIPGSLIVTVEADKEDDKKILVGERGNIKANTRLILPALDETLQTILYADAVEDFSGGISSSYNIVTPEDLKSAEGRMKTYMGSVAQEAFMAFIEAKNKELGVRLKMLDDKKFFSVELLELNVPTELEGKAADSFKVTSKARLSGRAYNDEELFRILENELKTKVHPEKRLVSIDHNSLTYRVVTSDSELGNLSRIKLAMTIKGVEEYDFNPRTKFGAELVERIKKNILGKKLDEAKYYIQNLEQIRRVDISAWPFWSDSVPGLDANIFLKIVSG